MNLHRAGKSPDWERLKAKNRNIWQRLAAATKGIVTPGNLASLLGFVLVLWGLWAVYDGQLMAGVIAIAIGRILDVADGTLADATGTKSPLGEAVDALIDKIEIAVALPLLVAVGVLWPAVAVVMALFHVVNAICGIIARLRRVEMHSSKEGKQATFAQWLAIALFVTSASFRSWDLIDTAEVTFILATGTFLVSTFIGIQATAGYIRDVRKSQPKTRQ